MQHRQIPAIEVKRLPVQSGRVARRPRQRSIIQSVLVARRAVTRPPTHQPGWRNWLRNNADDEVIRRA